VCKSSGNAVLLVDALATADVSYQVDGRAGMVISGEDGRLCLFVRKKEAASWYSFQMGRE
jgi:hypothetical protein